jgi:type I restriction enzyme S subunit
LTVGDGVGTGKVFHYVNGKYDLHQRVYRMFDFSEKITAKYFYYYFSNHFYDRVMAMTAKTSVDSVRYEMIADMDIALPEIQEQVAISDCFDNLDNLITLHQRKYNKLLNVKKSMLEKMFPKNGSNIPEIRFKGFTDPWEQRKLGDTVQITMGQSPDGSTYSDVPSDYILVQGNADLQNGWVSPRVWTSQMTKKADAGDLIMSVRAPAGAMGKTAYNAVIGRGVAAIKGNEFIYQLLVKMDSNGYWKALSCGSTFESLNSDNIKNADVLIPDVTEQEKIGEYFRNLDQLITLHQRELEKLQNIKKSMLEKMFV